LAHWVEEAGLSLDAENQEAVITLLSGIFGELTGTTRELMEEAV